MSNANGTPAPVPPAPSRRWWLPWLGWVVAVIATAAASYLGYHTPVPPPPMDVPSMGWVDDPEAISQVVQTLDVPFFGDTPAGQVVLAADADVFLWKPCVKVTGDLLPPRNQGGVGSCVSFGTGSAVEHLQCVQIASWDAARGPPPSYKDLAQEVIYGGSRVEIGGGKIRGDGSVGAWAADFVKKWGVVARGTYGSIDLTSYDENRCREYGRKGCPDDLEPIARQTPVKSVSLVRTSDEARKALTQGYPIAVCSNQGFSAQRDSDGFAAPRGSWAHCMAVIGYQGGARPGFFVLNSWGTGYHKGPSGKGDPSPAGFWADEKTVHRMLSGGDSWAFSDMTGFPARRDRIDWLVHVDRPTSGYARRYSTCDASPCFALAP